MFSVIVSRTFGSQIHLSITRASVDNSFFTTAGPEIIVDYVIPLGYRPPFPIYAPCFLQVPVIGSSIETVISVGTDGSIGIVKADNSDFTVLLLRLYSASVIYNLAL